MICRSCGLKNPDDNRFCGRCGVRLGRNRADEPAAHKTGESRSGSHADAAEPMPTFLGIPVRETHYPREGYEAEAETPSVSSVHEEFPPEVIEYDKRIPLIASPGNDPRRPSTYREPEPPPAVETSKSGVANILARESRRDSVEAPSASTAESEPRERVESTPAPRPHYFSAPRSRSNAGSVLGLSSLPADEPVGTSSSAAHSPRRSLSSVEDRAEPLRSDFLDFSERTSEPDRGLHGPSFLGLSSDPEFVDEEPVSHGRRNFALVVLALLLVLVGLQWRSIRDFGLRYAQSGSFRLPAANQPAATGSPAGNSENATTNGTPAAAGNGNGPIIEVAPAQNPNAANAEQQKSSAPQDAGSSTSQTESATSTSEPPADEASAEDGDASRNDATAKGNAKSSADAAESTTPQGEPDSETEDAAAEEPSTPARAAKKPRERQPVDDPSTFGATELAQANAAPDPATAATWLWKATAKGNWEAPVRLADMYITGRGVPQDCDQGMIILRSAAAKKNARARSKLGSLYATGQCVEQDRVQAYHWMSLALQANPGSEWIDQNRETLWSQMSADERRRAARDR